MDDFKRLETKVDKVLEDLPEIKADLRNHMRRTEIAEEHLILHAKRFEPLEQAHVIWSIVGKVLLAAITGALIAFFKQQLFP